MSDKNIEIMKRIIEEKKKKSSEQGSIGRPDKGKGKGPTSKGFSTNKNGGVFDK